MASDLKNRVHYSDDDMRDILARAITIEQQRQEGVSIDVLQHTATELGISNESLATALEHFESGGGKSLEPLRRVPRLFASFGALGFGIGLATSATLASLTHSLPLQWTPMAIILMVSISSALATMRSGRGWRVGLLEFEWRNAGLWTGFIAATLWAGSGASGVPESNVMVAIFMRTAATFTALSAVLGGAIAAVRSMTSDDGGSASSGASRAHHFKRRLGVKLKAWIDAVLSRASIRTDMHWSSSPTP